MAYLIEKRQNLACRQVEVFLAVRDAALLQAQADQDSSLPIGHGRRQPLGKEGPHQKRQQVQYQVVVHQVVRVCLQGQRNKPSPAYDVSASPDSIRDFCNILQWSKPRSKSVLASAGMYTARCHKMFSL